MATTANLEVFEDRTRQPVVSKVPHRRIVRRAFLVNAGLWDSVEPALGDTHSVNTAELVHNVQKHQRPGGTELEVVVTYIAEDVWS